MDVGLILAMTPERLIGRGGGLPWHHPEDLKFFKATTVGQTVIMGRLSFESIGRPLPKRTNVVVSRAAGADAGPDGVLREDGVRVFGDLQAACAWVARARPDGQPFAWIIGGAQVFEQVLAPLERGVDALRAAGLPVPARLVITWVPSLPLRPDDVLFPFDVGWIERHFVEVSLRTSDDGRLRFVEYALREDG